MTAESQAQHVERRAFAVHLSLHDNEDGRIGVPAIDATIIARNGASFESLPPGAVFASVLLERNLVSTPSDIVPRQPNQR